ncbi:GlxA family transcriptional regulator [Flavitalea flava]
MKHISILVLKGTVLSSLDASKQLFVKVNDFLQYQGKPPLFQVELVGISRETSLDEGNYIIHCDRLLTELDRTDLIIIPMLCGDFREVIPLNAAFVPWVIRQYRNNAEIASLCVGSYFLASTGLLNGKTCAAHWASAADLQKMYPAIKVTGDKIITYEQGIYTSGGAYSYLNLLLCLIEKYTGREMSVFVSKMFEIEIDRKNQHSFRIFMGQKNHEDEPIIRAQEFIENNYTEKITIDQLKTLFALSRRNFERRFKKATSNTVLVYIQRVRIEAVKKGLETTRKTIVDLMYEVGYSDTKAFRNIFKKTTGLSPVEYRNKYGSTSN